MTAFILTHLWQSTLFAGVAALLAWRLRHHHATTRHAIWMIASLKFLVPFSALVTLGRQFAWTRAEGARSSAVAFVESAVQPFIIPEDSVNALAPLSTLSPAVDGTTVMLAIWIGGALLLAAGWLMQWWHVRAARLEAAASSSGREVEILRRVANQSGAPMIPLLLSSGSQEPGVIGWFQSEILWPRDMSARLTDDQIAAIFLHELAHVKRRDNLLALLHMTVQALFWFHPVVWLIGARLMDERERACDEEVVRLGADPHQYAESILRTCEYSVEAPLVCVAGVTGSDLKRRLRAIVRNRPAARLGYAMLGLLTAFGVIVAGGPIAAGALLGDADAAMPPAQPLPTLKFEVASIKLLRPTSDAMAVAIPGAGPGNTYSHTGSIRVLVQQAYQIPFLQQIGGPEWIREDNYSINAKIPDGVTRTPENMQAMLRSLLADRFKLVVREETRDLPIYTLTHARTDKRFGPNLKPSPADCGPRNDPREECGRRLTSRRGMVQTRSQSIEQFARMLEFEVNRPVVDRTGLQGNYGIDLTYASAGVAAAGTTELPSLFTAMQEQLGLKLESTRAPVRVVVINSIDRPTED